VRRTLVFLLLFGAGLAILWWLERSGRPPARQETTLAPEAPAPSPGDQGALSIAGTFEATQYDPITGRALLRLRSENSRTEEGVDLFERARIELLEPATGDPSATLRAGVARLQRKAGSPSLRPEHENRVELETVEAEFQSGVPLAPLSVRAPEAYIDATDPSHRLLVARNQVRFEAGGGALRGEGTGAFLDVDERRLELALNAWVELVDSSRKIARLVSLGRGPLQIRREGEAGHENLVIEVWNGARLELSGRTPSTLSADHIVIRATPPEQGAALLLRGLDADGRVAWQLGADEFHGGRTVMTFDEDGELEAARLEDLPSMRISLAPEEELLPGIQPSKTETVLLQSEGAITARRESAGTSFDAGGPVSIETQDATLHSNGDVHGFLAQNGESAAFRAVGGVALDGLGARLETAVFALDVERGDERRPKLHGVAEEGSRLAGKLDDGRPFTLTGPGRMEVVRDGETWRIAEGTDIDLAVEGLAGVGGPMSARADRVSDFDLGVPRFRALGNVLFSSDEGSGSGDELVVEGPRRYTLRARSPARARLESSRGNAEAESVEVEGDRIHARGSVVAELSGLPVPPPQGLGGLRFDRYDLACDDLVLVRTPRSATQGREQGFRLEARGAVMSQMLLGAEPSDIRCTELSANRIERFADESAATPLEARTTISASEVTEAHLRGPKGDVSLSCASLAVERTESPAREPDQQVLAAGRVRFQIESRFDLAGTGDVLTIDPDRTAHLEASAGGHVTLIGTVPNEGGPFRLEAERADVSLERFSAVQPVITAQGWNASSDRLEATESSLELRGRVRFSGTTSQDEPWQLEAGSVWIEAQTGETVRWSDLRHLRAAENVRFLLGSLLVASGDEVTSPEAGILRFQGAPAHIETPSIDYEADWMEFDPSLGIVVSTGRGSMHPPHSLVQIGPAEIWRVEFLSSSTLVEPDSFVYVLQEPYFRYASEGNVAVDATVHASWSVLWLDRLRWQQIYGGGDSRPATEPPPTDTRPDPMRRLFGFLDERNIPDVIHEIYFEGPVEALSGAEQIARADAVYLDLVSGHGWLANTTVSIPGRRLGQEFEKLIIKTDWLRHSADGSLRADSATVTTCSFDEPHVKLVTGDLQIRPEVNEGKTVLRFSLDDNRVELYGRYRIPLARIDFSTDEKFNPFWKSFQIANSARFGQLLSLRFTLPARGLGRAFDRWIGRWFKPGEGAEDSQRTAAREDAFDARYHVDASYLGSRGGLLDLGFSIASKERYWYDFFVGGAYDDGEDRGFLRVPSADRERLRLWMRSHGTFDRGPNRWSLLYTDQSDFGVQSEFFESMFLSYEQDESYLQWKRRTDHLYAQASLKARVDSFRSDVEELPALDAYRGRAPLFRLGALSILHTGDVHADYVRRREGGATTFDVDGDGFPDPLQSPFGLPARFPDGLGNREVARIDTRQTLEAPWRLPFLGLTLVPFASVRATAWSEGVDPDQSPMRLVSEGGVRLGTTFWKSLAGGRVHQIAPFVQFRSDVSSDLPDPTVPIDAIERAWFGDIVEVGARSRFFERGGDSVFDLDLRAAFATDRSDGADDGWLPLSVFARLGLEAFGLPLEAWEDLRFDLESKSAVYALSSIGARFGDRLGLQLGHQIGRDASQQELFDAITLAGFYRWTEKWEFEARQSISLLDNTRLDLNVILRRFGHDAVFEIESSFREGEGSSFGVNLSPLIGFSRNRIGYLKW